MFSQQQTCAFFAGFAFRMERVLSRLMTLADYYFIMHLILQAQHKYDLLNKQVNELSADVEKQLASQSYSQKKITHQVL